MSRRTLLTIAVAVVLVAGIFGLILSRKGKGAAANAEAHPTAAGSFPNATQTSFESLEVVVVGSSR